MKLRRKIFLIAAGILFILIVCAIAILWEPLLFVYRGKAQVNAGKKVMDSLTHENMRPWIERTKKILKEHPTKKYQMGIYEYDTKMPDDLQKLKIIRVDVDTHSVRYIWMGGMDHTNLQVTRNDDGTFSFLGNYNDETPEVPLPKK